MSGVDDRVVQMRFDNGQFQTAVASTIDQLGRLKQSLNFDGSDRGMSNLQNTVGRFNMHPLQTAIENVNLGFLAMATVAVTALTNITNKAIQTGSSVAKALTIAPISSGLKEYETNLNSIQTVMANTSAAGTTLKDVNKALAQLNAYSDKTIYNFSEMAKNIGTFTAAGVDLDTSVKAIKGIANLAALSGSNSQQASTAMYQLSQALAAGKVQAIDWISVVNAGMGGAAFQRALAMTAEKMGTLDKSAVQLTGKMKTVKIAGESFKDSLSAKGTDGWLNSAVLTKTLEQFTGDMSDAQLKAEGFNAAEIKSIQLQAKMATDAATKVKTLGQVFDVAKETAGSGWAQTWQLIFGDFEEAKTTFTSMSNTINGVINGFANARNEVLGLWKGMGGRDVLIQGITNAFDALQRIIKPVHDAFRDIFPAKDAIDLFNMTKNFRDFTESLKIGKTTAENLKRTFRGVFAIFDIGKQVISGLFGVVAHLFGAMGDGSGGVLSLTGNIGDFLVSIDEAIKKGGFLTKFFDGLGHVLEVPIKLFGALAGAISSLFDSKNADGASKIGEALGTVNERLSPMHKLLQSLNKMWNTFLDGMGKVGEGLRPLLDKIGQFFSGLGNAIADNMSGENFDRVLDTINTGLFAGLVLLLKKFTSGFKFDVGGGLVDSIKETFGALTGNMKAMQQQVKAKTLLEIAGAIALLTASVVVLAAIDSDALARSLGAMTASFAVLLVGMGILTKIASAGGFLKIPFIAASMILLSTAVLILTGAVKNLSDLDWEQLGKGLGGVAALMAILSLAVIPLSANSAGMIRAGAGLILVAFALKILASSLKDYAEMNWKDMGKGLAGVAGSLVVLAAAMRLMPTGMVLQAAALVLIGAALKVIASALGDFATFNWKDLGKGLAGIAGALVVVALAMQLMPKGMLLQAAALILVGFALQQIGKAVADMSKMGWDDIGRGMTVLAGAMLILALGLNAMTGALAGAAALLVTAGALAILTPVLLALGNMSWEAIGKGLATLAGVFIILGLAGVALTPVIPIILALGAAIALIGVGVALAGAGILALATALTALVAIGVAGVAVLTTVLVAVIKLIPQLLSSFAQGLVDFAVVIGNGAPKIIQAFEKIFVSFLDMIIRVSPKIAKAFEALLINFLKIIVDNVPRIAEAGLKLLIGFLQKIRDNLGKVIDTATEVIVKFLQGLGKNAPKIVDAGVKTIIDFMNGISKGINDNIGEFRNAGLKMAGAIANGMTLGLAGKVADVAKSAANLGRSALSSIGGVLGIHSPSKEFEKIGKFVNEGFVIGLRDQDKVKSALADMKTMLKEAMDNINADIASEKQKLADLKAKKKTKANAAGITKDIKAETAALKASTALRKDASDAYTLYTKKLNDEQAKLTKLAGQYEVVTEKLKNARTALDDATKLRDDFEKSITAKFDVLPDINAETTLDSYSDAIRASTVANNRFKDTLEQLRKLGMDDATYQKFLDEGIDSQAFLDSLIASGASGVSEIDKITAELAKSASTLGTKASRDLYQAGVNAAQGLVDGLAKQQGAIEVQMDKIAAAMVKAIKKELGIKSPSTIFEEIGRFANEGLAQGLIKYAGVVEQSAIGVGNTAMNAVRDTLARVSEAVSGDLDMTPVIAPVLDLASFRKQALGINDILAPKDVAPTVSSSRASSISADTAAAQRVQLENEELAMVAGDSFQFVQNNTSPKALSSADIYRQTRNQLSIVKGALPR